jgi:GTP-binding protein
MSAPEVRSATFVAETRAFASLPPVGPPEIAIAGRSNVGKSTLLNRLAARHSLARTSKTPGRTRGIIFYDLQLGELADQMRSGGNSGSSSSGPLLRLADLPGYGYARVSQAERRSWQQLLEGYAERRPTLVLFVVLVDARRGIEEEEQQLLEWLATLSIPFRLAFTKVDKLTASQRGQLRDSLRSRLPRIPTGAPLLVSGQTGDGIPELWAAILRALPGAASESAAPIVPNPH